MTDKFKRVVPSDFVGAEQELLQKKRGELLMESLGKQDRPVSPEADAIRLIVVQRAITLIQDNPPEGYNNGAFDI